jgi:hypothetical protein
MADNDPMTTAKDFEWVKERAECSVVRVFELLRQQVQEDIKIRQEMRPSQINFGAGTGYGYGFRFLDGRDNFVVLLEGSRLNERVSFLREPTTIKATDTSGELILEGAPSLNPEGECVMRIKEKEFPIWYFRKAALEKLFFESAG